MSVSDTTEMTYRYIEEGDIHEIRLNAPGQKTTKELFALLSSIYYAKPVSGTTRVMVIQAGPNIPLGYFLSDMRSFISEHRQKPQPMPARFAVVMEKTAFIQIIRQMLKMMRHLDTVMFFEPEEYEVATTWLKR